MKNGPFVHEAFSRAYYDKALINTTRDLTWFGVPIVKCPMDLLVYQELIVETKPDLIVETGVFLGGTTLFFAHILDLLGGDGRVLGVELATDKVLPEHPRIDYLLGMSSTDPVVLSHVAKHADGKRCMVVLDSAHNRAHVLRELQLYSSLVTKGCYLIVEDTNVHGYRYAPGDIMQDGGPAEAVKEFQPVNKGFEVDRSCERLLMSFNPGGYLRRVR